MITSYSSNSSIFHEEKHATIIFLNVEYPSDGLIHPSSNFTATNIMLQPLKQFYVVGILQNISQTMVFCYVIPIRSRKNDMLIFL